jgi:hypothetical protein
MTDEQRNPEGDLLLRTLAIPADTYVAIDQDRKSRKIEK